MRSKPKKKKKSKWNEFVVRQRQLSERNQKLVDELNAANAAQSGNSILQVFTKWRFITYLALVFLPPYGLYRVWSKDSTFRESEKIIWTFCIGAYLFYFVRIVFLA